MNRKQILFLFVVYFVSAAVAGCGSNGRLFFSLLYVDLTTG